MTITSALPTSQATLPQPTPLVPSSPAGTGTSVSFGDVLDALNPLQHIPIVSNLYRAATGSQISSGSQIAGDTLYGALLPGGAIAGLISSAADVAAKQVTGTSIAQMAVNAVSGSPTTPAATPLVASTATSPTTPTPTTASVPAIPLMDKTPHPAALANNQYMHAQMYDKLNQSLLKMNG